MYMYQCKQIQICIARSMQAPSTTPSVGEVCEDCMYISLCIIIITRMPNITERTQWSHYIVQNMIIIGILYLVT